MQRETSALQRRSVHQVIRNQLSPEPVTAMRDAEGQVNSASREPVST